MDILYMKGNTYLILAISLVGKHPPNFLFVAFPINKLMVNISSSLCHRQLRDIGNFENDVFLKSKYVLDNSDCLAG